MIGLFIDIPIRFFIGPAEHFFGDQTYVVKSLLLRSSIVFIFLDISPIYKMSTRYFVRPVQYLGWTCVNRELIVSH